jgi:hypothetical protein
MSKIFRQTRLECQFGEGKIKMLMLHIYDVNLKYIKKHFVPTQIWFDHFKLQQKPSINMP